MKQNFLRQIFCNLRYVYHYSWHLDKEEFVSFVSWRFMLLLWLYYGWASACFLNLHTISHPHTGKMIADSVLNSILSWHISKNLVFLIISASRSNIQKEMKELTAGWRMIVISAMRMKMRMMIKIIMCEGNLMVMMFRQAQNVKTSSNLAAAVKVMSLSSLLCLAYTLQLAIHDWIKDAGVHTLLGKCLGLMKTVRKLSDAT